MATTSSSSSSNDAASAPHRFEETCETYAVDSRLLYNDIEQLSNKRFRYTRQLATWSRVLGLAAVASAGVAGLASYYQRAQIHRVWRLRHPQKVRQLSLLMMGSGGFSVCAILFLISPIGLTNLHEKEVKRTQQLDAIAVAALVQEQNFRTLAAWGAHVGDPSVPAQRVSRVEAEAAALRSDPVALLGQTQQWVWREVVLDVAPFLAQAKPRDSKRQPDEASSVTGSTSEMAEESGTAAAKQMAAELLLPSPPTESPATAVTEEGVAAMTVQAPRRVWTRTENAAELSNILDATKETWETLVRAKAYIVAKVF